MKLSSPTAAPRAFATVIAFALGGALAGAHPGHGLHDAGAAHMLSSPYHLAVLTGCGVVLMLAARFIQRSLARRVILGAGLTALATATVLWGLRA